MDGNFIGNRVRQAASSTAMPQYEIARAVGMKPDALSRAMSGQRAFSSLELAALAELLGVDIHWLITGKKNPKALNFVARHNYDHATGLRHVPSRESDMVVLENISLAYRQAGDLGSSKTVPLSPIEVRRILGDGFVGNFLQLLDEKLGVHVVRIPDLLTSYCFSIEGRHVIAIKATGNWFYENFCLAHELGHLSAGHLQENWDVARAETAANAFAAELLMPPEDVALAAASSVSEAELARWIWDHGVSTDATARRVDSCGLTGAAILSEWADQPTQRLLRRHWKNPDPVKDAITERMTAAAARHFPQSLLDAHAARIQAGEIGPRTLAWMLDVDPDEVGVNAPVVPDGNVDDLAAELGL